MTRRLVPTVSHSPHLKKHLINQSRIPRIKEYAERSIQGLPLNSYTLPLNFLLSVTQNKPTAVNIGDLYVRVIGQVFAQSGNKNIHTAASEIIAVVPDGFEDLLAGKQLVLVFAEEL